jgi:hypothetical protein
MAWVPPAKERAEDPLEKVMAMAIAMGTEMERGTVPRQD